MKRLKALALLLLAGFLAFAPPGTLILLGVLIASWFGWEAALAVFLIAGGVAARWIVIRARSGKSRTEAKTDR